MKIAVDLDDVLVDLVPEILLRLNKKYHTPIDKNLIRDWYMSQYLGLREEQIDELIEQEFVLGDGYENLPLISGAKSGLEKLASRHQVFLVTYRDKHTEQITLDYVKRNLNNYPVYLTNKDLKVKICLKLGASLLIDDSQSQTKALSRYIPVFLFNQPWNESFDESEFNKTNNTQIIRVKSWQEITSLLT